MSASERSHLNGSATKPTIAISFIGGTNSSSSFCIVCSAVPILLDQRAQELASEQRTKTIEKWAAGNLFLPCTACTKRTTQTLKESDISLWVERANTRSSLQPLS